MIWRVVSAELDHEKSCETSGIFFGVLSEVSGIWNVGTWSGFGRNVCGVNGVWIWNAIAIIFERVSNDCVLVSGILNHFWNMVGELMIVLSVTFLFSCMVNDVESEMMILSGSNNVKLVFEILSGLGTCNFEFSRLSAANQLKGQTENIHGAANSGRMELAKGRPFKELCVSQTAFLWWSRCASLLLSSLWPPYTVLQGSDASPPLRCASLRPNIGFRRILEGVCGAEQIVSSHTLLWLVSFHLTLFFSWCCQRIPWPDFNPKRQICKFAGFRNKKEIWFLFSLFSSNCIFASLFSSAYIVMQQFPCKLSLGDGLDATTQIRCKEVKNNVKTEVFVQW